MFKPRPNQQQILKYEGGWMAVSAVPGSGKTHTLSALAGELIAAEKFNDDQEILIVTLTNSAVNNFVRRINLFINNLGLPEFFGYRVRTLHGLAHDIIRERPDLAGLPNQFVIIDETDSHAIIQNVVASWQGTHPEFLRANTKNDIDLSRNHEVLKAWNNLLIDLSKAFIKTAKDLNLPPEEVNRLMQSRQTYDPLLDMGIEVYSSYQRALSYRSALDFDDLVRLALLVLRQDPEFLQRLRYRWPFILEDEAQDSSRLQEEILKMLAGDDGNWVRVGDPNQAIYETFTTASPKYLREFIRFPRVLSIPLPQSGRSTLSIIALANEMIRWTINDHPNPELRDALTPPYIDPTSLEDNQPNPQDLPEKIYLFERAYQPAREIETVTISVKKWLADNPSKTVAILVTSNNRGGKMAESLKQAGIETVELLQNSGEVRRSARLLASILDFLSEPGSTSKLVQVIEAIYKEKKDYKQILSQATQHLRSCRRLEEYLWPTPDKDWLSQSSKVGIAPDIITFLAGFRQLVNNWQLTIILPVDQLILTIAPDIFITTQELNLSHQIAMNLEMASKNHPEWQLPDFAFELKRIVSNSRSINIPNDRSDDFDPDQHRGKVVITTIHKAKGLEWDRVFLLSANNYDFPSAEETDQFISEKWFVRDSLNLEAETLARLKSLAGVDWSLRLMEDGVATQEARLDYARERLRVLFVGITRAKSELVITWNTGKNNDCKPALAFEHLRRFWQERTNVSG